VEFSKVLKVKVTAGGDVTADGQPVTLEQLAAKLSELRRVGGGVCYYREDPAGEPHENATKVIQLVAENGLPIRLSTSPDFSDSVDAEGVSHPHPEMRDVPSQPAPGEGGGGASGTATSPAPLTSSPPRHRLPAAVFIALPALVCGWAAGTCFADGPFSIVAPTPAALVGAAVGLVVGVVLYLDDRRVGRFLEGRAAGAPPGPSPAPRASSEAVAVVMLAIPLIAGVLIWQGDSLHLTNRVKLLLAFGTVLSTSLLGYLDARQLALRPRDATAADSLAPVSPAITFGGMLALWFLCYPIHFLARRRQGARNLLVPALVATVVFLAPSVRAWLAGPGLPAVADPEVVALVRKVIQDSPDYQARKAEFGEVEVREPVEVSFDPQQQRRVARARLVSKLGEQDIFYVVEWGDRGKGVWAVRVSDRQPE
jgi:hypothetical protein